MRTRETIEAELLYYAERCIGNPAGLEHYRDYIHRMQLDVLIDIRDTLTPTPSHTTRLTSEQVSALNRPHE